MLRYSNFLNLFLKNKATMPKQNKITEKQLEYINILSSYVHSKYEDAKTIVEFLNERGKKSLEELTKEEALILIEKLLEIPTEYVFPCGKRKILSKRDVNCYNLLGELEACLHECGEVDECPYWAKRSEDEDEYKHYVASVAGEIVLDIYKIKCQSCNKYIIDNQKLYDTLKDIPIIADKITFSKLIHHHIDYDKDITVFVCQECHRLIHKNKNHPLYPINKKKL